MEMSTRYSKLRAAKEPATAGRRGRKRPRASEPRPTRTARRERPGDTLAVEPCSHEAAAVIVAEIGAVVLQGAVPDRDVDSRGELHVVLLLGQIALQVVDDLAPLRHVEDAPLA